MIGNRFYLYFIPILLFLILSGCTEQGIQNIRREIQIADARSFHSISGTVTDKNSGLAIENAEVSIKLQNAEKTVQTGPEGLYEFENLPKGSYLLTYGKPAGGYQSRSAAVQLKADLQKELQLTHPFTGYCYGGSGNDAAASLTVTKKGTWLVAGSTDSYDMDLAGKRNGRSGDDLWLFEIEPGTGKILFSRCYGGKATETAVKVIVRENGELLLLGMTTSYNGDLKDIRQTQQKHSAKTDIWFLRLSPKGHIFLNKCYGGSGQDVCEDMLEMDNGDILIAGHTESYDGDLSHRMPGRKEEQQPKRFDLWLLRINPDDGKIVFNRTYGSEESRLLGGITQTQSGDLAIAALTMPYTERKQSPTIPPEPVGALFLKVETTRGDILTERIYRGKTDRKALSILPAGEKNLLIAGVIKLKLSGLENWHPWYMEIEPVKGDVLVNSVDGDNIFLDAIISADSPFFVGTGMKKVNRYDFCIVKTDPIEKIPLFIGYYGGSGEDRGIDVIQSEKSSVTALGTTKSIDGDLEKIRKGKERDTDIWLLHINIEPEKGPEMPEMPE